SEIEQDFVPPRRKPPSGQVLLDGEGRLAMLPGIQRQFGPRRPIRRILPDPCRPPPDPAPQAATNAPESLLGRVLRFRVAGAPDQIKQLERARLLPRFMGQESQLESHPEILRLERQSLLENLARRLSFTNSQVGVA